MVKSIHIAGKYGRVKVRKYSGGGTLSKLKRILGGEVRNKIFGKYRREGKYERRKCRRKE